MQRVAGILVAVILAVIWLYISRFWVFEFWDRDGLLGIKELRPGGDLLRRDWLRGTMFRPYDLVIWVVAGFLLLTVVEKAWVRLTSAGE